MEFLKPNLIWVGPQCYRTSETFNESKQIDLENYGELQDSREESSEIQGDLSEDINVEQLAENSFRACISIPSTLFKYVIGAKGIMKKRIEAETGTRITIPKPKVEDDVVIKGIDRKGVISAYTRLSIIADSMRQKQMFTHFISIPLSNEITKSNFENFKENVLRDCVENQNITSSLFQDPLKLHLTVGTLILLNENDRKTATSLLNDCKEALMPLIHGYSTDLSLKGLEYMNDDPSEVDVLYVKVFPSDSANCLPSLQMVVDVIADIFKQSGLMVKQYDNVKIHATAMNTLFRIEKSVDDNKASKFKSRECFNANMILQRYKDIDFGKTTWNEVHLSQRYTISQSGYYKATAKIKLL